jgi:SAM-dependent methyltransferase
MRPSRPLRPRPGSDPRTGPAAAPADTTEADACGERHHRAVTVPDRHRLRTMFEEVPELYDRARPTYPPALFDDLVRLGRLPERARVLEIGPGTGKATRALAERGLEVTAVELGEQLAAFARRSLAAFPNVEVVHAPFETWETDECFDAVVAFTAFHWIDPDVRYAKPARLLRAGGALAFAGSQHALPECGDPFWLEVQEDYDAIFPSEDNRPPPPPEEVEDFAAELEASGLFGDLAIRRHVWDVTYTADQYVDVLNTYSGHRKLPVEKRRELYERIRRRIEAQPGGTVRKTYVAVLHVARRL